MVDLVDLFAVGMRIFPAGFRAYVVDEAFIVAGQEMTRQALQDFIIVFICTQEFRFKVGRLQAQVSGDALNVFFGEERTSGFATVGALQAVDFCKNLFMRFFGYVIQVFGRFLPQAIQKFPVVFVFLKR